MSTMTTPIRPVNPMAAEAKDTVMAVLRRDQEKFFGLVEDPQNWNLQTRCTEWEVRDLVGHMIDVTEGYLSRWEIAKKGDTAGALGLTVMGETLNDHALDFRKLSRDEALGRLKADRDKMMAIFDALTPEEWTSFMVTHPYMGPVPAGFYPAFHIMDYGIHPYDIEYGLGDKLAEIDEATAGVLIPYCHIIMQYTVDQESAKGVDCVYGFEVSGGWGGRWRATIKDGQWSAQPESGDWKGCDALFKFTPSDFVLTVFGRFDGGAATGDPEVIQAVRRLFFRF
ncbi:MAG TPA: maleylpyruvate isomerase N-terminal domain-containing protein [Candidatus Dormibacteraeota bacterium]